MLRHRRPVNMAAGTGVEVDGVLVDWVVRSTACLRVPSPQPDDRYCHNYRTLLPRSSCLNSTPPRVPITWEANASAAGPALGASPPLPDVGPHSENAIAGAAQRAAPVSRARGRYQVAKSIEWYYGDRGKIVGPMSFEEVAGRINRARNEKHLVWTEGMARWTDAKTVPAFTDLFRTNPRPLPALALSSLSSEDEIVWIKPGSRASPPMLPVLRMPPVWRDEPSAIAQPLNDASPSPVVLLTLWRREVRHLGSTVTLLLGTLAFFGAASRIGNGDPLVAGVLTAGLVLILGALVYRSAKRRRLGEVASTPARWVLEGIAIVLMFLIVLLPAAGLSVLFR